jgi:hypothetical protein
MDLPQELSLAWRKDNKSPLLARFVADLQHHAEAAASDR